jgi:16S rRNA processing protein RimM
MEKKDFYFLGKIKKTSGYQGNLVFFFDVDDISHYKGLEAVFVELHGELIPFAISHISFKKDHTAIVKLEEVSEEDSAKALAGCSIYLPLAFLPKLTGNKFYFHEISGFTVIDENYGKVGTVQGVADQGSQAVMMIKHSSGKEVLMPVTDEIIKKIDRRQKNITVNTPEGLIEIYL